MAKEEDLDEETEEKVERTLKISEIGLILDTYDDIFSDFDPRPYSDRALSVDFLEEAERASRDKPSNNLELNFLIPKSQRDMNKENMITKRLKEHFRKHYNVHSKERGRIIRRGAAFIFFGVILMFLAAFILYKYQDKSAVSSFLVILFEPASWFLFWEGLNQVIFESNKIRPKEEFYKKMHRSRIHFFIY